MGPAEENLLFSLEGNRYLGKHLTLNAGAGYKYILDRDHEGGENFTNVDSRRLSAGLSVTDLPMAGFSFDLFGSYYLHPTEDFYEITAEVGYLFTPRLQVSTGATRGVYDFSDWLLFHETGGVQASNVVFLETRYQLSSRWRIVLRGEYEDVDGWSEDAYMVSVRVDYHYRTPPPNEGGAPAHGPQ
jgi:hypothetical protein